jgi:hypothetical protein
MVYNTQNYWVFLTFSIFRYFEKKLENTRFRKLDPFLSTVEGGNTYLFGPLERANLSRWTTYLFLRVLIV